MNGSLGIGDLSHGISVDGARDYLDQIQRIAIREAQDALSDLDGVRAALQAGWQGQAEAQFEQNLIKATEAVKKSLEELKTGLDSVFAEITEEWAEQDKALVSEEEFNIN